MLFRSYQNTALGFQSLVYLTTGYYNVMIGCYSGTLLTTGSNNTATGYAAGYSITTGYNNTLIGSSSGRNITTGWKNVLLGINSGYFLSTGQGNIAVGGNTLYYSTSGQYNTAIGGDALFTLTTGYYNTAIGSHAGSYLSEVNFNPSGTNSTPYYSTYIGFHAFPQADNQTNQIVIGANVTGNGSYTTTIGGTDNNYTYLNGILINKGDILPTTSSLYNLGSSTNLWLNIYAVNGTIQTSDKNKKDNIIKLNNSLDFINSLNPVNYTWKGETKIHSGLIAQEVEKINPNFGGIYKDDNNYGLNYTEFIAPLIGSIQELNKKINELTNEINLLKNKN